MHLMFSFAAFINLMIASFAHGQKRHDDAIYFMLLAILMAVSGVKP